MHMHTRRQQPNLPVNERELNDDGSVRCRSRPKSAAAHLHHPDQTLCRCRPRSSWPPPRGPPTRRPAPKVRNPPQDRTQVQPIQLPPTDLPVPTLRAAFSAICACRSASICARAAARDAASAACCAPKPVTPPTAAEAAPPASCDLNVRSVTYRVCPR